MRVVLGIPFPRAARKEGSSRKILENFNLKPSFLERLGKEIQSL